MYNLTYHCYILYKENIYYFAYINLLKNAEAKSEYNDFKFIELWLYFSQMVVQNYRKIALCEKSLDRPMITKSDSNFIKLAKFSITREGNTVSIIAIQ